LKIEKSVDDNGFHTTTKNIILNNNLLNEKQMNDLQNISLNKGGTVALDDYEKQTNDIQNILLKKGDIITIKYYEKRLIN
jgi:hypothetical protein